MEKGGGELGNWRTGGLASYQTFKMCLHDKDCNVLPEMARQTDLNESRTRIEKLLNYALE
jgi:hypothetical protein